MKLNHNKKNHKRETRQEILNTALNHNIAYLKYIWKTVAGTFHSHEKMCSRSPNQVPIQSEQPMPSIGEEMNLHHKQSLFKLARYADIVVKLFTSVKISGKQVELHLNNRNNF